MVLNNQNEVNLTILGCGYVGSFFIQKHPHIFYTNRKILSEKSNNNNQIYFDLNNKASWHNITTSKNVLWTFPAAKNEREVDESILFFNNHLKNKNVIVLSSTSAYCTSVENEIINEDSNIFLDLPRFCAEEKLREQGATILHLSGIIGPNRTPLNWYKKNLIKHEENILNYIHIFDIIYFIEKLFYKFKHQKRFNLSSQDYKTHIEISQKLVEKGLLEKDFKFSNQIKLKNSKKVDSSKILHYIEEKDYQFKKYPEDIENKLHE